MARSGGDAAPPRPEFRRRRELGAASARSLLLTVLGEFVLPGGEAVWTAAFLRALGLLGVEEKAVRQALARSAAEGWLAGERRGRRTAWRLTPAGERLLTDGTERIYGFGGPVGPWDGRWLLVLATVPETSRKLRHLLRTRLAWSGLGNLSPGVWVSPHPGREAEVRGVLAEIGVADTSTLFTGELGDLAEARRVARQAWDLDEIELAYEDFLDAVGALRPADEPGTFAAHTRLVQEWRRFPFLDPALPAELLPDDWSGSQAFALFHERHDAWRPAADRQWKAMSAE
ncbi:transcriptional regulator, PaaX family [Actinomadura meyerae]|jgi:phenylacetic acid degradation operon negative regulatory protein|uniref:Transcriptional regulator, PaaX family n=1 Tax=Actinomadura meyerae TaxID=240840 RepID=A0A239LW49_9ACTN|nr:PaaX family transcriptional regulator C-terminal domain-containing protein [Actinomadura meyerae]SNT34033.1 transcriptional regulator, PaaX family [Actinomadura meyerae]